MRVLCLHYCGNMAIAMWCHLDARVSLLWPLTSCWLLAVASLLSLNLRVGHAATGLLETSWRAGSSTGRFSIFLVKAADSRWSAVNRFGGMCNCVAQQLIFTQLRFR